MKENHQSNVRVTRRHPLHATATKARIPVFSCAAIAAAVLLGSVTTASAASSVIKAIGVENEYADVISQIGGQYVQVTAIETDPNTDPHTFEVNPKVAGEIAAADLVVKNGVGYDAWADKIIAAALNGKRTVIDVQHLLGLPDSTPNPHLW
ncbi:metal ABC transporter substrate-binding protein [Burkholderia cepacia]|uniref:metal ABC transporter substrate-binding protein n=1 Tax=Burkholderia cepacia TaxID=292 RepID=UPI002AB74E3B|nr:zinc ABC transporter substrate-binding protein [Burkholderia cepacia]